MSDLPIVISWSLNFYIHNIYIISQNELLTKYQQLNKRKQSIRYHINNHICQYQYLNCVRNQITSILN